MHKRRARRAHRSFAAARGFTLIELMVVVMLVALLAAIAVPSMRTARDDRMSFDYARTFSQILHRGRTRAAARGGAHLVVIDTTGNTRGTIRMFEAVDTLILPAQGGPKPNSSCKTRLRAPHASAGASIWFGVPGFPGTNPPDSPLVEGTTLEVAGNNVNTDMNVRTRLSIINAGVRTQHAAIAMCFTPGGSVYAVGAPSIAAAIDDGAGTGDIPDAPPFTGVVEVAIQRHDASNNPVGVVRRVLASGAGAPRIQSQ